MRREDPVSRSRTLKVMDHGSVERDAARLPRIGVFAVVAALAILGLYYGQDLLVPLAIAILFAFILGPVVTWARRVVPLPVAVAATVLVACAIFLLFGSFVLTQLAEVAGSIASYQANLHDKVQEIRKLSEGGGTVGRFLSVVASLGNELTHETEATPAVRVQGGGTAFATVAGFIGPLLHPVLTIGVVLILVIFLLLDRDRLSDRFVRLFGAGDVHATAEALADGASRLGRVLSLQLLTNFAFGIVVSAGLYALGMPNAVLWGLLAGALRYIPYAGTALGALLPALIALAVVPGWLQPFLVLGWIVLCDLILGQIIEPLLFGEITGVSPLALLISAIFWGTLWGPVGLLLSTPLTVCLLVIGRHVPQLAFLHILLGDQAALPAHQQIYNRLIRNGVADASAIVSEAFETKGADAGLDDSLGRMVALAEADRAIGRLSSAQIEDIVAGTDDILEFVDADKATALAEDESTPAASGPSDRQVAFSCVGGRGQIDNAAAAIIAFALRQRGLLAGSHKPTDKQPEGPGTILLICYASPPSLAVRRYAMRKLTLTARPETARYVALSYAPAAVPASALPAGPHDMIQGDLAAIALAVSQLAVQFAPKDEPLGP